MSGVPSGVTTQFVPPQITAGQTSLLTLSAPASQGVGPATLTISAAATVNGIAVSQSATASLNVQGIATSFMGRAGVDDALQTPLAGVTVTFLGKDGMGGTTACSGQTQSDEAGNFSFTGLPDSCIGEQLIRYDGSGATTAKDRTAGTPVKYAGVDLLYNIVSRQVTTPPNVIRLPRIDNKETVLVAQNSSQDQTFSFKTIPNLSVTVYAGTTFTLADGSHPDPFPLIAVDVPIDRLPDEMPNSGNTINAFIVAFQPANAVASQPVAVDFPNTLNNPPGANLELDTLNPTIGMMVKYGTGTVSNDGMQIIADADPAHPNHHFGLVHFDWHGPQSQTPNENDPGPGNNCPPGADPADCTCPLCASNPVDLSSGVEVLTTTDIGIRASRGPIGITRTYRTLSSNPGPFGIGTNHNYGYQLNTFNFLQGQGVINLIMPDGNQFPFNRQPNGTFINSTIPTLHGAVLTNPSGGVYNLRWRNGTIYQFQPPPQGPRVAFLTSIADRNGNTVFVTLNPSVPGQITQVTDPVGRSLNLGYDSANRITSITDPVGRTVHYSYNGQGTLATVTDPIGGVTKYDYDLQNRLIQISDPRGIVTEKFSYDAVGRVSQAIEADGGVFSVAYTTVTFDITQVMLAKTVVTDPRGNQTTYRFNPLRLVTDVIDPSGQIRSFIREPGTSNKIQGITGSGSCPICGEPRRGDRHFTFDVNGNVLTSTDALGNKTTFTYEPVFNKVTSVTDALGNVTSFTYDSHGNLLTQTDAGGHTTSFVYNSFGQATQITDALGNKTTLAYDNFGNLISTIDPLGNTRLIAYDAISRPVQTIDALGRRSQTVYDPLNRVTKQVNPLGTATQFAYDGNSNLISFTDANGHTTSFTYDPMNRLSARTDPLGKNDARTYDSNGNLIQFVDRRGQTSSFFYDSLNRLIESDYQDGTVTQTYDASGRLLRVNDSAAGEFDFSYDAGGRLFGTTNPNGSLQYTYDADSRTTSRQVVGQPALQYSYDPTGNLLSASLPLASVTFAYDPRNQLASTIRGNGISSQYRYDPDGRLLSLVHSGPAGVLNAQSYAYDAIGNRTSYSANIAEPLVTHAIGGNTFDSGNRLLQSDTSSLSYDANGNLVSETSTTGVTTLAWDSRNRLIAISGSGAQANFQYDFAGNLIFQSVNGRPRTYLVDDLTNVAMLNDNGDQEQILSGRSIDQSMGLVHKSGQIEYSLTDALNSTVATTDQNGEQIGSFFYEPFGQSTSTEVSYPFGFTGRLLATNDSYQYRARFYLPMIERFISEDPVGLAAGANLYSYVRNSPTNFTDPTGLDRYDICKNFGCILKRICKKGVDAACDSSSGARAYCCYVDFIGCMEEIDPADPDYQQKADRCVLQKASCESKL